MPVYEYRCTSCGEELEVTQSFSDDPLTECPACQGLLKKKFGVPGITFKGSGFYKTDSRGSSSSKEASTSASGDSGPGSGSTGSGSTGSGSSDSGGTTTKKPTEAAGGSTGSTSGGSSGGSPSKEAATA